MRLDHGKFKVLGFRLGDLAYCTDVSRINDESQALLQNLDVLVLDALRFEKHPTHFSLAEALVMIEKLRPKRAILTHLSHSFDYHTVSATLPPNVELAYDGLRVTWPGMPVKIVTDLTEPATDTAAHATNPS